MDHSSLFGIGTYRLKTDVRCDLSPSGVEFIDQAYNSVMQSLINFPWHYDEVVINIDTAPSYKTEESVGRAIADFIAESGIDRSRIKITTKVSLPDLKEGMYETVKISIDRSLERIGVEYLDEVLIHQPVSLDLSLKNWIHLLKYKELNPQKVREIGVSNYAIPHLKAIVESGTPLPNVNQIEVTPFLKRDALREFCDVRSIQIVAHSPLAKGEKFTRDTTKKRKILPNPVLQEIADLYSISEAQVMIYWALAKGLRIIPRSSSESHIGENFGTYQHVLTNGNLLTPDDIAALDSIEESDTHVTHPQYLRF
jgi:2,5-diketo-D-gluconate reductase A